MKLEDLHAVNPYENFKPLPMDLDGWHGDHPIFRDLIHELCPRLIIEVGTWKGMSAIHMADEAKRRTWECKIVCVDTWLGALEFWTNKNDGQRYKSLNLRNGYPSVYYQFLSNVIHNNSQEMIIPFPQTSLIAARWFKANRITADLIYIDASHDQEDVEADIAAYSGVLRPGGILFGDDYGHWPGVKRAADLYGADVIDNNFWKIKKPCAKL